MLDVSKVRTTGTLTGPIANLLKTNFQIETKHGDRRSTAEMSRNPGAIKKLAEVCGWLHLVAAKWIGSGWSGGPSTPIDRLHAAYQDKKFNLRIGRYRGFLVEMVDDEGHQVTSEVAWKRWNDRFAVDKPAPSRTAPVPPVQPPAPSNTGGENTTLSATPEAIEKVLRTAFPRRVEDLASKDLLYTVIAEQFKVGKTTTNEKRALGQFVMMMSRRGYITELAPGMYGFEDKAIQVLGGQPQPPTPAPQPMPAPQNPGPSGNLRDQLAQLLEDKRQLDDLTREHGDVTGKLGNARHHITQLTAQIAGLRQKLEGWQEEESKLSTRVRELDSKLYQLKDVEESVRLLAAITGR